MSDCAKFAAFEIKTNHNFPEDENLPGLIFCASVALSDDDTRHQFYDLDCPSGRIAETMTQQTAVELLDALTRLEEAGYQLCSWNGLGYDLKALAASTERFDKCRELAFRHTDVMFDFHCRNGYPVSLRAAAQAMEIATGEYRQQEADIPSLWASPAQRERIVAENGCDAQTVLEVARYAWETESIAWITRRGQLRRCDIPGGPVTVCEALKMPQPDTGWMSDPIPRKSFYEWTL